MVIRTVIVDDHAVVRAGLRTFLGCDPEIDVVGEAADGEEAIQKARALRPEVVLLDLLLPRIDGISVTATICREIPRTRVIVLTSVLRHTSIAAAFRAGATGYLPKNMQADELRTALKVVAAGEMYVSPQTAITLLQEVWAPERSVSLTEREKDVLQLLAQGYGNKEMAYRLHVNECTVKTHIHHVLSKLGVQSRTQAVLVAMRLGLLAPEEETLRKQIPS